MTFQTYLLHRPCLDHALCVAGDACAGHCSQPAEARAVSCEALRTGEHPADLVRQLNDQRAA